MNWDPIAVLDEGQRQRLDAFADLLLDLNQRINLISREDEDHVFVHHIRHCLFLTHRHFPAGSTVVDWGTGGGLPAIPMAIAFPDVRFVAIDAIHKKIRAVRTMARRLDLENLEARQGRAEEVSLQADYSISRATAPLADLWTWHRRVARTVDVSSVDTEANWKPGLICLKGGDLSEEIRAVENVTDVDCIALSNLSGEPYYQTKLIVACSPRTEPDADGHR